MVAESAVMRFRIEDKSGRKLHLEASDWMMAMVRAASAFGASPSGFDCERKSATEVQVTDPRSGDWWRVLEDPDPEVTLDLTDDETTLEPLQPGPSPMPARPRHYRTPRRKALWAPARSSGPPSAAAAPSPPNLEERLAELTSEIRAQAGPHAAAAHTLKLAMAFVTSDAGAVLRANEQGFEFFVVQGGAGSSLLGRRVPLGKGIVGASFDAGVTIRVEDVRSDPRHLSEIDADTGFSTRSVLCVPIRSDEGFHGAIELLNAPAGAVQLWHVEAVETLAAALAEALTA